MYVDTTDTTLDSCLLGVTRMILILGTEQIKDFSLWNKSEIVLPWELHTIQPTDELELIDLYFQC